MRRFLAFIFPPEEPSYHVYRRITKTILVPGRVVVPLARLLQAGQYLSIP